MKTLCALWLSITAGHASSVLMADFSDPPFDNSPPDFGEIAGTDGWTTNEPTADFSFIVDWNGTQAAGLGGAFVAPTLPDVNLSHAVTRPLVGTTLSLDFSITAAEFAPGKDNFGFSLSADSGTLMSVAFESPGGVGDLEIAWYDSAGTRSTLAPSLDVLYGTTYSLTITFDLSGADVTFDASLASSNTQMWSGTLAGQASSQISSFSANYEMVDDSDSFLIFDNLNVIPEPQSGVLCLVAGAIGLLRRRRK